MKFNIQRTAKCIASFMGIALALVLCITPAFASDDGIYNPADYLNGSPVVDANGVITYNYTFGVDPLSKVYVNDVFVGDYYGDNITIDTVQGDWKVAARVFPLGVYAYSNSPMGTGVVNVRDFVSYSQFELSASFDIDWSFLNGIGTYTVRWFWAVYCYDDSGWYAGTIQSETKDKNVYTSVDSTGTTVQCNGLLQLPENTSYILPMCYCTISTAPLTDSSYFTLNPANLTLSFSIDSVLENTLTMQVIKDQLNDIYAGIEDTNNKLDDTNNKLDDTNDKLDDIFNGTPEDMQDAEQNASDLNQEIDSFESIMEDLEQYEKIDQAWSADVLTSFLSGKGYLWVKDLISPLVNWSPYGTLMLTILALVNLSLILFGR